VVEEVFEERRMQYWSEQVNSLLSTDRVLFETVKRLASTTRRLNERLDWIDRGDIGQFSGMLGGLQREFWDFKKKFERGPCEYRLDQARLNQVCLKVEKEVPMNLRQDLQLLFETKLSINRKAKAIEKMEVERRESERSTADRVMVVERRLKEWEGSLQRIDQWRRNVDSELAGG
jgi:hypothetical protein